MIVPDASVVVTALVDRGGGGALARAALSHRAVHVPHLLDIEVSNALRGRVRGGKLAARVAEAAVADLRVLPVTRHEHTVLLARVWQLRDNVTSYDAAYLALAELLHARVVTGDVRLARTPGLRCEVEVLEP